MRTRTHLLSSILAIMGGALFLVLPVAFLNGAVSINYVIHGEPSCTFGFSPTNPHCLVWIVPMPREMARNLIFLGIIGILLGFLALRLNPRPRTGLALGLTIGISLSLGLTAFMFEMAISRIRESFGPLPDFFQLFPDLSILMMAGAAVVFVYEFLQARFSLPLTIAEANAYQK